jgi:hypothetical protein
MFIGVIESTVAILGKTVLEGIGNASDIASLSKGVIQTYLEFRLWLQEYPAKQ